MRIIRQCLLNSTGSLTHWINLFPIPRHMLLSATRDCNSGSPRLSPSFSALGTPISSWLARQLDSEGQAYVPPISSPFHISLTNITVCSTSAEIIKSLLNEIHYLFQPALNGTPEDKMIPEKSEEAGDNSNKEGNYRTAGSTLLCLSTGPDNGLKYKAARKKHREKHIFTFLHWGMINDANQAEWAEHFQAWEVLLIL